MILHLFENLKSRVEITSLISRDEDYVIKEADYFVVPSSDMWHGAVR
jgi:hypothetical protein